MTFSGPETGFDIYKNRAIIDTSSTSLATIAGQIASDDTTGVIPSANLLLTITTGASGSITATGSKGLVLIAEGASLSINDAVTVSAGTGSLVLAPSSGTTAIYGVSAISTPALELNGATTTFALTNSQNSISAVALGALSTSITSLVLTDNTALTIGAVSTTGSYYSSQSYTAPSIVVSGPLSAAGAVSFFTNALSLGGGSPAVIAASSIQVGPAATGGTVAVGSGLGTQSASTLLLSSTLLNQLLADTTDLIVGEAGAVVNIGSAGLTSSSVYTQLEFEGAAVSVSGALALGTGSIEFLGDNGATISVASGASVSAGSVWSNYTSGGSETIVLDGNVTATSNTINLTAGSAGSISIASGVSLTAPYGVSLAAATISDAGNLSGGSGNDYITVYGAGSFTEDAGVTISGYGVYVRYGTSGSGIAATIDGALDAAGPITIATGTGGALTLGNGAILQTGSNDYALTLDTDTLTVPTPAGVSISAGYVTLDTGYSTPTDNTILVGTATGSGLQLTAADLSIFGSVTPVTIGNTSYTHLSIQGITLTPNYTLYSAYYSVSGDAYDGTSLLGGVGVELVINDTTYTTITTSYGAYTFNLASSGLSGSSFEVAVAITTPADAGVSFYDGAALPLSNFNVYAHEATITTGEATLSAALTALTAEIAALPSADQLFSVSGGVLQTAGNGSLLLAGTGSSFGVDDAISTGIGVLTVDSAGTVAIDNAVTTGAFTLAASGAGLINGSITTTGNQSYTAPTLTFQDGLALSSSTGAIAFKVDSLTLPASIAAPAGVSLDSYESGGAIGLGDASGTFNLSLNNATLTFLGATGLTIGDSGSTIVIGSTNASTLTLPSSLTLNGSVISIYGAVTLPGAAVFDVVEPSSNSSFILQTGGDITAGTINIDPASIAVNGVLNAGAAAVILATSGGSITLGSAADVTSATSINFSTGTNGSLTFAAGAIIGNPSAPTPVSIATDNFVLPNVGAPSISATSIALTTGTPNETVTVGGPTGVFSASVLSLFSGFPVTLTAGVVHLAPGYTPPANFSFVSTNNASYQLGGTLFGAYGSSSVLSGDAIEIVVDGTVIASGTQVTTDSAGVFSTTVNASQLQGGSTHDVLLVLLGGGSHASAFYDLSGTAFTGLDLYAGSVYLSSASSAASIAISNFLTVDAAQLTTDGLLSASLARATTSAITSVSGMGLIIDASGAPNTTFTLDVVPTSGNGVLTLAGAETIDASAEAITANTVSFDGSGTFNLTNANNQIANIANAASGFGAVTLIDASALTLGSMTASGQVEIRDNAVSVAGGAIIDAGGGLVLDTYAPAGSIGLGSVVGDTLTISSTLLGSLASDTVLTLGDGANTIDIGGSVTAVGGLGFNGAVVLAGSTTIDGGTGPINFDGTVNAQNNSTTGLTLATSGNILFNEQVGTPIYQLNANGSIAVDANNHDIVAATTNYLSFLTIALADNVTVGQTLYQNTSGQTVYPGLFVHTFATTQINGTLSLGNNSLESDGDVSIIATTVEGRIVAGNSASISAGTVTNANVTAGTITVAANDVTDSTLSATRSADVTATGSITGSTITAGTVANISATSVSNTTVTAQNINASSGNYSGDQFNSPNAPKLNGGDASIGDNTYNGAPVSTAVAQLASLTVPTNATNPKVSGGSSEQDASGSGDDSSGGSGEKKKKGEKGGKAVAGKTGTEHKAQAKTYDAANQFLNKLLSAKKPSQPPI